MDKSSTLVLISNTYTVDSIGQKVPIETQRTVFCSLNSVTQTEWDVAGRAGHRAEYRATMFAPDYNGEIIVMLGSTRYGVYRTYRKKNDEIELYLEQKTGA